MNANPKAMTPADFSEFDTALPDPDVAAAVTNSTRPEADYAEPPSIAAVFDVPVKVQAILGGAKISINELLNTRAGTVIELDRRVGEPVDVVVNGRLLARGELVLIDGLLGVTLTELVKSER